MAPPPAAARSPRELRKFGLTVGGVFLLLATVSWYRGHVIPPRVMWTLGAALVVPGLLVPSALAPVERGWMRMAAVLGHVNTRIILGVLFYVVFTPVGFVLRRFRDPMTRRMDDGESSHWVKREQHPVELSRYQQQF
jgi:hypothetical protein